MRPKKVKRGGPRENAGRKVDSTGEYSKARTPEERRRADRENKAKSRGQEKIPEDRTIGETSSAVQKGPGRPPSNQEKGPLKVLQEKSTNWRTKGKTGKNRRSGLSDKQQWQTEKTWDDVITSSQLNSTSSYLPIDISTFRLPRKL